MLNFKLIEINVLQKIKISRTQVFSITKVTTIGYSYQVGYCFSTIISRIITQSIWTATIGRIEITSIIAGTIGESNAV